MDDLISRQGAIDALNGTITLTGRVNVEATMEYIRTVADRLNRLPSVQPERPKGEWVGVHAYCNHKNEEAKVNGESERYLPSGMVIGVYCNQCWCRADKKSDFCPNCGTEMMGVERDV